MNKETRKYLTKELKSIIKKENEIKSLIYTLPDLAKRKKYLILELSPHHKGNHSTR